MITFYDTPSRASSPKGSFWILDGNKKDALQMARGKIIQYRLRKNDRKYLVPISFATLLSRLENYDITPPELIEQVEQL